MEAKTIKVSRESYEWLLQLASELQRERNELVSFDEALKDLRKKRMKTKISRLAGSVLISDTEAEKIKKDLRRGWGKWKIPSV